jgi:hypothetical protein
MSSQPPLGFDLDAMERTLKDFAGPTHLPSLTAREKDRFLTEHLVPWVEQLVVRFDVDVRVIPPCWLRHNGMVEALSALRDHERACYSESASPTAAADWFRVLREIEARLVELAAKTRCSVAEHREGHPRDWANQTR